MKSDKVCIPDSLCYQGMAPVEWARLSQAVEPAMQERYRHENEVLLRGMLVMEAQSFTEHEEEPSSLARELLRIDHKLNLVLELLAQTLRSWRHLPTPVPVKLNTTRAEWFSEEPVAPGESIMVRIYLSPVFPNPLVATAAVHSVRRKGEGFEVSALLDDLGEQVREALEKMIFRQHRRAVARARKEAPSCG